MTAPATARPLVRLYDARDGYRCRAEVTASWPDGAMDVRVVSEDEPGEGVGSEWTVYASELDEGVVVVEEAA